MRRAIVAAAALLCAAATARAQTRLVIVSGLGGAPKYSKQFASLSATLARAAHTRFGIPDSAIVWLGEDSVSKEPYFRGQSTRVNVERTLQQIASGMRPGAGEQLVLVLIGHGNGEGEETKISLPGPDLSARDFSNLLSRFGTQRVAFVDLTSASGDALPVLSAPNRVVITATKSAFERNESQFATFFVEAFTKDVADTDKDGRISLLEAFRYATTETKRFYENGGKLQTEHAQLDDSGNRTGSADPDGRTGQGMLARRFFIDGGVYAAQAGSNDPKLTTLYREKFALEEQIDALRRRKTMMTAAAYDDELEKLLVELALRARSIRTMEGRKP